MIADLGEHPETLTAMHFGCVGLQDSVDCLGHRQFALVAFVSSFVGSKAHQAVGLIPVLDLALIVATNPLAPSDYGIWVEF